MDNELELLRLAAGKARRSCSLCEEWARVSRQYMNDPTPEKKQASDRAWQAYESSWQESDLAVANAVRAVSVAEHFLPKGV